VERPRLRICLCLVAVVAPCAAGAQTTTADGVAALMRGDYQTAARILRPLADEAATQPDPLAQYFMAMLYDSGLGVTANQFRACALYQSAAKPDNPLMAQSRAAAEFIQTSLGLVGVHACSSAPADRWSDPPATSITLGPGYSITIDDTGATVSYQGAEYHTALRLGGPGFIHLPIRYTPVDVSHPAGTRRHFIQFLFWTPARPFDPSEWILRWRLSEVVGPDLIPVTLDTSLVTIVASQPPMAFAVDSAVEVRVNANGEAEWVVRGGPNPGSGVIPDIPSIRSGARP
jgi:hypothetical protein